MNNLKLYGKFIAMYLKSRMEYRFSFFLDISMPIFSYAMNYLVIWIMLNKFQTIYGWTFYEVMFLYTLNLLSYALSGFFLLVPMRTLEDLVNRGEFDGMLTRPINPFLYLIFRQFQHIFIGHLILSTVAFVICLTKLNIVWSIANVGLMIAVVLGGSLIQSAFLIITGSLSFWFINSTAISASIINSLRGFTEYPIGIYNKTIQVILTFVLPYAFIAFYPAEYFLNKESLFYPLFSFVTPIIGITLFILSYKMWKMGVNSYHSTGS